MRKFVIFSDLDATLLDESTYSYKEALDVIELLKNSGYPLIFCTSKTAAETFEIVKKLNLKDGFSVENGGATFIGRKYESFIKRKHRAFETVGEFFKIEHGIRIERLIEVFSEAKEKANLNASSIFELGIEEFKKATNLKGYSAELAFRREYDLPFVIEDKDSSKLKAFIEFIHRKKLKITKGGRFYHLTGNHTKGDSVRVFLEIFWEVLGDFYTIALGDSENDFEMLSFADYPVVIPSKSLKHNRYLTEKLKNPILSSESGSQGWRKMILSIVKEKGGEDG